jgi:CRISPR-associated protein Cmr4
MNPQNNKNNKCYTQERYLIQTLDPLHVGTGGNRLGRVDNSIVREPGTKLPKIPGTALHGAIRQYAAVRYEKLRCAGSGQNSDKKEEHCKDSKCPICYTFGYLKGQDGGQSGRVNISDARLLVFPVYSMAGPVWITCPCILNEFDVNETDPAEKIGLPQTLLNKHSNLNLGWLMLEKAEKAFIWPEKIKAVPEAIKTHAVLVSDSLFSHIVNSNLEVRTSVSIDPETGAAKDGALFTYEAIPRSAILFLDVIEDDYRNNSEKSENSPAWPITQTEQKNSFPNQEKWNCPLDLVSSGLKVAEMLGIGGMGTRGFGRVRMLNGGKNNEQA